MKSHIAISASLALVLSLAACERTTVPAEGNAAPAAEASAADADAVKQAFAKFNADIAARNVDAIRTHYANDAVMVIPDRPPFVGIEAIMADYKEYAADPAGKYAPGAETVTVSSGDMAYGEVNYQSTYTDPKTKAAVTVERYNLSVYRKQPDGSWKVVRDVNSPLPKAEPAAPPAG